MSIVELRNENEVNAYLNALDESKNHVVAMDIEAEFNLHCYGEHLCLIQLYDREREIIIDPLKFKDPAPLKRLFEKRDLLKIVYDSGSDACLLENEYGIRMNAVLDLRPAVTLLEFEKQSLSNVLHAALGMTPINKKKFQRYNWMRRPIDAEAIEYAMNDVRFLFELKDHLMDKLLSNDLLDTYMLQNLMLQDGNNHKPKKEKYEKAKGYYRLDRKQQALFRQVFAVRDSFAKKINKPPHYVFSNADLIDLCRQAVQDTEPIAKGINPRIDPATRAEIIEQFASVVLVK